MEENPLIAFLHSDYKNRIRYVGPDYLRYAQDNSLGSVLLRMFSLGFYIRKRLLFSGNILSWGMLSENKRIKDFVAANEALFTRFSLDELRPRPLFAHVYYDKNCVYRCWITDQSWEEFKTLAQAVKHIDSKVFWQEGEA